MRLTRFAPALLVLLFIMASGCSTLFNTSPDHDPEEYFPQHIELAKIIASGNAAEVAEALAAGADPDTQGPNEHSLLQWALMNANVDAVAALLEAGADPNAPAASGQRPLETAVSLNISYSAGEAAVPLLLEAGADVDGFNTITGSTALNSAAVTGSEGAFEKLLEAGADPNIGNFNSSYPLHAAARVNKGSRILLLLEAGADPLVRTSNDATFQDYYFGYNKDILNDDGLAKREAVVDWLESNGYEVHPDA